MKFTLTALSLSMLSLSLFSLSALSGCAGTGSGSSSGTHNMGDNKTYTPMSNEKMPARH